MKTERVLLEMKPTRVTALASNDVNNIIMKEEGSVHLSVGDELVSLNVDESKASEVFNGIIVKEENVKDEKHSDSDENSIDPSMQYINITDPLDIVKKELDDGSTKKEESNSDEKSIDVSMQYINTNDVLDIVKNELDDDITSTPAPKKPRVVPLRNLEDITNSKETQFNNSGDKIEQKNHTEIAVRQKPIAKGEIVIPTNEKEGDYKSTFSENINTSVHHYEQYVQIEKSINNISVGASVSSSKNLNIHRCNICQKCFSNNYILNTHIRTHTGEKPCKCKLCEKCFSTKSSLNKHTRTHSSEKPFKCKLCEKPFSQKDNLNKHIRTHTGMKPLKCKLCEKHFSMKSHLYEHIRTHTGEKPFKCKLCEKCFSTKSSLNKHIRTHTSEKPFKCNLCEKCFSHKDNLNKHIRTHTGEKPLKCELCEKHFSTKSHLYEHIRTHTGEKPFKCKLCVKCFTTKSSLNKHIRTHSGEKPYEVQVM